MHVEYHCRGVGTGPRESQSLEERRKLAESDGDKRRQTRPGNRQMHWFAHESSISLSFGSLRLAEVVVGSGARDTRGEAVARRSVGK
jgi:hypothetical protein